MSAAVYAEPYKLPAGAMALAVHAMFFMLLYFGVNWRADPPQGMEATLWTPEMMSATAKAAPQVAPVRVEPPLVEQVEPPKPPEPSKLVEPPKLAEPVQPVVPPKADIELAEKKKKKELAEKERQKAKLAEIKKQMERKKIIEAEKARQSAQAERERVRAEQAAQAEQERARAAQAAAIGKVVDEHKARIVARIRSKIVMPPDVPDNARAEFDVTLLPGGSVLSVKLAKPSGNEAYDAAVERAIFKAQPLPLPADVALFNKFRELHLIFSPKE
ncbi:MAG: TonB family protein [Betaproteobacteria bacterium]|nr:TonB family protein [Betaproteobacteria bacterium]